MDATPPTRIPTTESTSRATGAPRIGEGLRIENLEHPQYDDRAYRIITLPNKLEALLIHETGTDKASAALDVNVGSFSDAKDMPGIAHAVEHLLFMGSSKYPEENAYRKYLATYGGECNAFTTSNTTNYYFDLFYTASDTASSPNSSSDSPLWGGLDRLGQFFISPLFLEDTVDREIEAIDSEHKKNLQNDKWRLQQLNKALANPDHPYCHFSTGSWKTLHDDPIARGVKIRDEFMKFHSAHYSANRMKLVVLGRESLDTLEQWVKDIFSKVPNKNLPRFRWEMPVYTEKELLTQIFVKPILEIRSLELQFPYRDEEELYKSRPSGYLSHLLGHEGPGSVFAYVKDKGWANSLEAGGLTLCPGSGLFSVIVRLSEEGLKNYKEVVKIIFQYIAMIREQPPQKWIVDEQIQIEKVNFRFKQKSRPSETTSSLAGVMQKPYDRTELLSGPAVISDFDPNHIIEAMSFLRPNNFRMTIVSQDVPGEWDQKEKWYGTEYKVEKISEDFRAQVEQAFESKSRPAKLHFPHKNEFIPSQLEVEIEEVGMPTKEPKLIRHDDDTRVWWKKDDQFWTPEANVHVYLRTPITFVTARVVLMCALFRNLVNDALVECSYNAYISGLAYDFSNCPGGLCITVNGYNDKLRILLEMVLLQARDLKVHQNRFDTVRDRMLCSLRDWNYLEPYSQMDEYSRIFKTDKHFTNEELLRELSSGNVTATDVQKFYPRILAQCQVEMLAHGNLSKKEALTIMHLVEHVINPKSLPANQLPIRRNLVLPAGSNFIYERQLKDPDNVNHCVEYSLYVGDRYDNALRAKLLLIRQMMDEPCFNQLRTIEQLGYVVFSGARFQDAWAGYCILVQSEKNCKHLEGRIENFLNTFEHTLQGMSLKELECHKHATIDRCLAKLNNFSQENTLFWKNIYDDSYDFMGADLDAEHIAQITKEDIIDFYARCISTSSAQRVKLSVHLQAQSKSTKTTLDEKVEAVAVGLASVSMPAESPILQEGVIPEIPAQISPPVVIKDIDIWKTSMPVSAGVTPVRSLRAFLEVAEKS